MQQCLRVPGARTPALRQNRLQSRAQCIVKASAVPESATNQTGRRAALGLAGMAAAALLLSSAPAHAEPFLASTGEGSRSAQQFVRSAGLNGLIMVRQLQCKARRVAVFLCLHTSTGLDRMLHLSVCVSLQVARAFSHRKSRSCTTCV